MNLLIDSHALIWFLNGDAQLSQRADSAIRNPQNNCYVSKASLWEIAIKINLGKLHLNRPFPDMPNFMATNNFQLLLTTFDHILSVSNMPLYHRDPFDRMLIA